MCADRYVQAGGPAFSQDRAAHRAWVPLGSLNPKP